MLLRRSTLVFSQGMRQFNRAHKFLQSWFLLESWHIRPTPTFLRASLLQYHEQQQCLQKDYSTNEVFYTSLYCRDYVPLDILPSDVGGYKNAPLMVGLPHDSLLLSVGEFLCQNMLYWNILSVWNLFRTTRQTSRSCWPWTHFSTRERNMDLTGRCSIRWHVPSLKFNTK